VECAPAWRSPLLSFLKNVQLTVAIGKYAQDYHLGEAAGTVTENVRAWRTHWPTLIPLPHPSPRNNLWLRRNPWFEKELVPVLCKQVAAVLG
jgi:uracil-DNA glycosylase